MTIEVLYLVAVLFGFDATTTPDRLDEEYASCALDCTGEPSELLVCALECADECDPQEWR